MAASSSGPSAAGGAQEGRRRSLDVIRRMLAVVSAPADDTWGDAAAERHNGNLGALGAMRALLAPGPAGAVENPEDGHSLRNDPP